MTEPAERSWQQPPNPAQPPIPPREGRPRHAASPDDAYPAWPAAGRATVGGPATVSRPAHPAAEPTAGAAPGTVPASDAGAASDAGTVPTGADSAAAGITVGTVVGTTAGRTGDAAPAGRPGAATSPGRGATAAAVAGATRGSGASAPIAVAAAAPDAPPQPPDQGTVYTSRAPFTEPDGSRVLSGRLPRLRVGWHTASSSALTRIGVSSPGAGLVLGTDIDSHPVPVRVFRPEPTRITLVGGVWAARLLAFRALAVGADIVVLTNEPRAWYGLGEQATGRPDRLVVVPGDQPVRPQGTPNRPALVVYDLGMAGPSGTTPLGPWQAQLTVLRQLDERGVPAVQDGNLVVLQRLQFTEAALAASALRLTGQSTQLLQRMQDDMLALVGGGADRYVWATPTPAERQLVGSATR